MKNIFLDFDETITQTIDAFCRTYNMIYNDKEGFLMANPKEVKNWDFREQCTLLRGDDKFEIFEHDYLFENLKLFPNAREILQELSYQYNIIICTIGTFKSISKKTIWISENLPMIKDGIFIKNKCEGFDKSVVDMKNSIFIDDHEENLFISNAKLKICFGEKYNWNKGWDGIRAYNWLEIRDIILSNK